MIGSLNSGVFNHFVADMMVDFQYSVNSTFLAVRNSRGRIIFARCNDLGNFLNPSSTTCNSPPFFRQIDSTFLSGPLLLGHSLFKEMSIHSEMPVVIQLFVEVDPE
jgi:hypothetical protein